MSHCNEPWRLDNYVLDTIEYPSILDASGSEVVSARIGSPGHCDCLPVPAIDEDVRKRIVACVNFCAGLDDDTLRGEPLLHSLTYYQGWLWDPEDGTWGNAIPGNTADPPYWIPSANRSLTKHATHDGTRPLLSDLAIARPAE